MPVNGQQLYEEAVVLHKNCKAKEALDLYTQAMLAGYEKAYASMGVLLLTGEAGYTNPSLAKKMLELGAAANHPRAVLNLAKLYESTDIVKSRKLYEQYLVLEQSVMPADEMLKILGKVKDLTRIETARADEHRRDLEVNAHLIRAMRRDELKDIINREVPEAERIKMPKRPAPVVETELPPAIPAENPGKLLNKEALDTDMRRAMQKEFAAHKFALAPTQPELKRNESPMELPMTPTNGRNCSY